MDTIAPPAPSRPTALFTIMLGLIPVPLRLFSPIETVESVKRKTFSPDGNPVGMPLTDTVTGLKVSKAECSMKVNVNDQWVELTDEEIAEVTSGHAVDNGRVDVETFIPLEDLDSRYRTYKWYQARPQERVTGSGKNKVRKNDPNADKTFTLLLEAMKAEGVAALVRVGLRGPARYGALTPDGHLHFLQYDSEIRQERDMPEVDISEQELTMARTLIQGIGSSSPVLEDHATEALVEYLEHKANGEVVERPAEAPEATDNVLDLTAMLMASMKAVQPVADEALAG